MVIKKSGKVLLKAITEKEKKDIEFHYTMMQGQLETFPIPHSFVENQNKIGKEEEELFKDDENIRYYSNLEIVEISPKVYNIEFEIVNVIKQASERV